MLIQKQELAEVWSKGKAAYSFLTDPSERSAQSMMFCDFTHQLPNVILRGADLMSMMWSIEVRSVFVRRKVAQFAFNLPLNFKVDPSEMNPLLVHKKILKNLFLRKFPKELLVKKQGFAGFPNESGAFLGDLKHFKAIPFLGVNPSDLDSKLPPETHWKLVNIEFFLREFGP